MTKKIFMSLAPLLAVAAFAVVPAMAQAQTRAYGTCAKGTPETKPPCKTGEHFTAFANGVSVKVVSKKAAGTGDFILENVAKTADVDCSTFSDKGTVENVLGIGTSKFALTFDGCKGSGALASCEINPLTNHEITGEVSDEVNAAGNVVIKIVNGFNIKCGTIELGNVTSEAAGTVGIVSGNVVTFTKATGLTFRGEAATITGADETETEAAPKKKVFIN